MLIPARGVTKITGEGAPFPKPLVAATEHEYTTPPVSPKMVIGELEPLPERVEWLAAVQAAV